MTSKHSWAIFRAMTDLAEMLGQSPAIEAVRETMRRLLRLQQAGRRPPALLLQGETGTGKGLVARLMHRMGSRSRGRFVDVNCAAIPDTLIEAELFGYERGAFTDARRAKAGLFQTAHLGTIFLDEVGMLPAALQAKLLTVIEERSVRRLGSTQPEPADAWIVSATNADLLAAVRTQTFREDLYHRLSVLVLRLPPLRERAGDILLLAEQFLTRVCADYGLPSKRLDSSARERLMAHAWPGNIRELSNAIERAALLTEASVLTGADLALGDSPAEEPADSTPEPSPPSGPEVASLNEAVREHLQNALDRTGWNISRTAAILGITRNTLRARIARLGLAGRPARSTPPTGEPRQTTGTPPAAVAPALTPGTTAPPKVGAIRWDRRRIALMRIVVEVPETAEALSAAGRTLETLIEKVQSFGGRVESLGQQGLEASFGVEPVEDAPRRAVHAAMAVQRAVERERETAPEALALKVAIVATQAMVAQAGTLKRIDEDVRNQSADALDRLLAAADPTSILLDRAAATLLERRFELVPLSRPGSGSDDPIYRLAGREGSGLSPGGRMAAFAGRDQEMAVLRSRLDAALRGQGQLVSIVGEAGIGKSRLLFEFRQSLAGTDVTYVEGRCLSYGNTTPYLPILDLIRAVCGIVEADSIQASAGKIRQALAATGDAEARTPHLLHLLGYEDGTNALRVLPPDTIKALVSDSLRQLTLGVSQTRPLLIVVEDLHWTDQASEEMLASLVNALPGTRVLFVTTHRPGYEPPWASKSFATRLSLPPLSDEDSLKVAHSVVPAGSLSSPVASAILTKAEGNPFFLEELVLAVQSPARPTAESWIPDTVQGVLTSRIERLPDTERALLQSAAVVGKDVPLPILAAIADLTDEVLRSALRHLCATEFLYEVGDYPEIKHRFRHALTHEVAYESLEPERRLLLHSRILSTIEQVYGDRRPEHVDRLAHHALRGQAWDKALIYLRQAGTQAFLRSANREAVGYFEQALGALGHLPSTPDVRSQAVDLRFDLRTALLPLGQVQRGLTFLQEAEAIAAEGGDEHRRGQIAVHMTGQLYLLGEHGLALEYGKRAQTITQGLGDFSLGVATHAYLGQVYHVRGDYREAAAEFRQNVESLAEDRRRERFGLPQPPSIHSRTCLVWSLAELGDFAEGISQGEEAIEIAREVAQPLSLTVAHAGLGQLYARMGEVDRAIPLLEQALDLTQTWNIPLWFPRIASALGMAYSLAGRGEESIRLLGRAVEESDRMGLAGGQALVVTWLAEAHDAIGDPGAARRHADRAYEMARRYRERGHEAWALRLLGELADRVHPPDPDQARTQLERARALGETLMMRPLVARCHLGLGRLLGRGGCRERAIEELEAAGRTFAALGMTYWSRQVDAERAAG